MDEGSGVPALRLRNLRSKVFSESTDSALEESVNAWLDDAGDERLARIVPLYAGSNYAVLILYSD